ncbi:hypothetical protein AAFC00_002856 [Neodothiora populina]|uniref:Checkpoint protein RAD24-like helical bundle domain-containing protein n=1 Tax=Neodothiora populina TaxID=2781224 RepID=A0ABR3P8V8_9PEZI
MGQPRPGRRKAVVLSSDEDEDDKTAVEDILSDDEVKVQKPALTMAKSSQGSTSRGTTQLTIPASSTTSKPTSAVPKFRPGKSRSQATKPLEASKRGSRSIYSFFNAATQRQQSQQSVSPEKPRASQEEFAEDILDDISGDDTAISFAKGSRTALTVRKRKFHDDTAGGTAGNEYKSAQKFRKISDGSKATVKPRSDDTRPWTERFAPADLNELAVHRKKVQDVRGVLQSALSNQAMPRLVVLKGPAGSGKTTTVNLIAKDINVEVIEWKNPMGAETSSGALISASAQFEEFILRSGQFAGLQLASGENPSPVAHVPEDQPDQSKIMLVEEFPSSLARTSTAMQSFRSTILQFLAMPRSATAKPTPLVVVVSEALLSTSASSTDSFTAHRLLGPQILAHPLTVEVEFNPIATTYLTKALELIVLKEARRSGRRRTPGSQILKHITETGDMRSAVSSLEFLCVKGDDEDTWSAKIAFTKPKGGKKDAPLTKQEIEALKLVSNRESSLGIFHAVGKVVYNKRMTPRFPVPQPPNHIPQHRKPKVPELDVDVLINELGTDTSTFVSALHENYALSCNSNSQEEALDSLCGCLDAFSDTDLLSLDRFNFGTRAFSGSAQDNLRQDDISFQNAVRGLLFALPSPVHRGEGGTGRKGDAFRMFYPASLKIWKSKEENEGIYDLVVQSLQTGTAVVSGQPAKSVREGGVESWKRGSFVGEEGSREAISQTASTSVLPSNLSTKAEMLLDRLPYASQILSTRPGISSSLLENMVTLTSFQGSVAPDAKDLGDADNDADDEVNASYGISEWSIDRPKVERERLQLRNSVVSGQKKIEVEGGGLHIPVEHEIEKLVLSDDDIED